MTGIKDSPLAVEFMKLMAKPMSTSNRDGIGYTAVRSDGSIFSQRWHNNNQFFDTDSIMTPEISKKLSKFKDRLPVGALDLNYGQYGEIDYNDVKTLTMHTRFATCERTFANVHPFIDQDISLVHNGTISNAFALNVNKISTCDSEAALQTYISEGVLNDSSKAKKWLDLLSGSWAFGILGRNISGNRILDVVRGSSSLYYLEAGSLGRIFTTNDDDAKAVLKEMNIEITLAPTMVEMNSMHRFDALTGELVEKIDIKPVYNYSNTGNHSYYQGSGTSGMTSSRGSQSAWGNSSRNNTSSRMSQKDIEYTAALMADAMGKNEFPDVLNQYGEWDYRKLKQYYCDSKEPLLDRLDMWDQAFDADYAPEYEALPYDLKEYVQDVDRMQGFKEARRLIKELGESQFENMG
jgi:hypothetical protein